MLVVLGFGPTQSRKSPRPHSHKRRDGRFAFGKPFLLIVGK